MTIFEPLLTVIKNHALTFIESMGIDVREYSKAELTARLMDDLKVESIEKQDLVLLLKAIDNLTNRIAKVKNDEIKNR